jgi:hypothetical protein
MPIFCSVCSSSQQQVIDRRLRAGESLCVLSADYGLPVRLLKHHRDEHVLCRPRRTVPDAPCEPISFERDSLAPGHGY